MASWRDHLLSLLPGVRGARTDQYRDLPAEDGFTIRRSGTGPLTLDPPTLTVSVDTFSVPAEQRAGQFSLDVTSGWRAEVAGHLAWSITGVEMNVDSPLVATLKRATNGNVQRWELMIPVALDLSSTLDPVSHTFPEPNRAAVLGDILPDSSIFGDTYRMPSLSLARDLFDGLYSDIVFLRRDGPTRGGLCSGMARFAIARSLGDEPEPSSREDALRRITTYHGRQLSDRSFLLGVPTFLRGSPAATYRTVRRDLLRQGWTDRAFDVAIPKPWRPDVISALISKGHTIVPYRIRQPDPTRATVEVYDPNRPPATLDQPEVVEFDLKRDRYAYRHMVSMDEGNVGLVAARQAGYARQGTAIAAGLVSMGIRLVGWSSGRRAQSSPAEEPAGL